MGDLGPYFTAFALAFAAALGTALALLVRRIVKRLAARAGRRAREVVSDAVENAASVRQISADVGTMRGQLDRLAWRVTTLENRRPGGRRRSDPPRAPNGPAGA